MIICPPQNYLIENDETLIYETYVAKFVLLFA